MINFAGKELERELLDMIVEVCKITDPVPEDLSPTDPLIGPKSPLGLDSLDAVEIVVGVEKKYNVRIDAQETSRKVLRSIATLAAFIKKQGGAGSNQSSSGSKGGKKQVAHGKTPTLRNKTK